MKYTIEDHKLYDPTLCGKEFATLAEALDHLAPTFDKIWPNEWFIKKNAGTCVLGVYNTTETDSFAAVATIRADNSEEEEGKAFLLRNRIENLRNDVFMLKMHLDEFPHDHLAATSLKEKEIELIDELLKSTNP